MSWIVTGILAGIVLLIVWTEARHERRSKIFHAKVDPAVNELQASVLLKYRERFGKDPTIEFPLSQGSNAQHNTGDKKP
jgi:hypothetical protein